MTERQQYRLVEKDGDFEIRYYPPANTMTTEVQGTFRDLQNKGFGTLAGYIFGANDRNEHIAMTAPVIMEMDEETQEGKMTFVLPSGFDMKNRPQPKSQSIDFDTSEGTYTASLGFGGFASREDMEKKLQKLLSILNARGIKYDPKPQYLYYDPPFRLLGRHNEVSVKLIDFQE